METLTFRNTLLAAIAAAGFAASACSGGAAQAPQAGASDIAPIDPLNPGLTRATASEDPALSNRAVIVPIHETRQVIPKKARLPDAEPVTGDKLHGESRVLTIGFVPSGENVKDTVGGETVLGAW